MKINQTTVLAERIPFMLSKCMHNLAICTIELAEQ
jgi:hypothetical protein